VDSSIHIFPTPHELAEKFAEEMISMVKESNEKERPFTVAFSGGSTPELLFSLLGDHYARSVSWKSVHIFWVDERCVSPDDVDSNFRMANMGFISKVDIPASHIHRMKGEEHPETEALRYSNEISENTLKRAGLPVFDLIILGLGDDGHTASIFQGDTELLVSEKICDVAIHPISHQRRITLTGRVINNANRVVFLVTGKKKASITDKIINRRESEIYPASYIAPVYGKLKWYLDKDAAGLLKY